MSTHTWGDDWPYWDDLYKAEDMLRDEMDKRDFRANIKEKFGTLRCHCTMPDTPESVAEYRAAYKTVVDALPHIKAEILEDADWFRECLVGLVPESECDHKSVWHSANESWCGVCGKNIEQNVEKETQ